MSYETELIWRTNKYEVMSHSQNIYKEIKSSMQELNCEELQLLINKAYLVPLKYGSVANAYEHMWGYFKKYASQEEKIETFEKLHAYKLKQLNETDLWKWLGNLSLKYEVNYLLESSLIKRYLK